MTGVIYKITCEKDGKIYIGQASLKKYKNGKPYNYGISGRWSDHVSSSKRTNTPISTAIKQFGSEAFKIECIEEAPLDKLDELEAKWILHYNSTYPHGLNVAKHSRDKHRLDSTLANHYKNITDKAVIHPIKCNNVYKLVYVVLYLTDGGTQRITFGNNTRTTFDQAMIEAKAFANELECDIIEEKTTSDDLSEKYASKLSELEQIDIRKIKISTSSNLIAVYISDKDSIKTRICFGGKHISTNDAYIMANKFISLLNKNNCIIEDIYRSKSATGDRQ
jgi:hypothetical protein